MIPGLGEIPGVGEIFNNNRKEGTKREILLSITPHIVKSVRVPRGDVVSIWSGGEDDLKFGRNFGSFTAEYEAGQKGMEPLADPALQKKTLDQNSEGNKNIAVVSQLFELPGSTAEAADSELIVEPVIKEAPQKKSAADQIPKPIVFIEGEPLVKQGDEFSLSFRIEEVKDLFSAPLYVQYDPDLFEFISATEGTFFNQGGAQTIFTNTALDQGGRIIVGIKQGFNGSGVSGGGELFSMLFRAKAPGKGEILPTRTNFRDIQAKPIAVESLGLMVEVTP